MALKTLGAELGLQDLQIDLESQQQQLESREEQVQCGREHLVQCWERASSAVRERASC